MIQYDFFEPIPDKQTELEMRINTLEEKQNKQCRAQFAKIGASAKEFIQMYDMVHQMRHELDGLRRMLSK